MEITKYLKTFDRSSFDCGKPELNEWLQTQASQHEKSNNTRTFLGIRDDAIVGYYATTTYRLELDELASAFGVGKRRYPVPAVLLARLAVDVNAQGEGLGARLLIHALGEIAQASEHVGFEVVVVHAINEEAVTFYARFGFIQFEDHHLRLFLPVRDLVKTLGTLG